MLEDNIINIDLTVKEIKKYSFEIKCLKEKRERLVADLCFTGMATNKVANLINMSEPTVRRIRDKAVD